MIGAAIALAGTVVFIIAHLACGHPGDSASPVLHATLIGGVEATSGPVITGTCKVSYPDADVAVSVPSSSDQSANVSGVTVVFYNSAGEELGSGWVGVTQTIAIGSSLDAWRNIAPADATSCQVVSWLSYTV